MFSHIFLGLDDFKIEIKVKTISIIKQIILIYFIFLIIPKSSDKIIIVETKCVKMHNYVYYVIMKNVTKHFYLICI